MRSKGYTEARGVKFKTCGTVRSEETLHEYEPRVACSASHDNDDADAVGHSLIIFHPKIFLANGLPKAVSSAVTNVQILVRMIIILPFT